MPVRGPQRWASAAITAIVVAGALPAVARASTNTINFSANTPGTSLSTQYQSQDVTFGVDTTGAQDQPQPLVVAANANPPPAHVAQMVCGSEACRMTQWIEFAPAQVSSVSLRVEAVGQLSASLMVTAYDASGNTINGASASVTAVSNAMTPVAVSAPSVEISYVTVAQSGSADGTGFAFSDLTYGPYSTTSSPYFAFVRAFPPSGASVFAGSTSGATFILRRYAGSSGPISWSYSGAPQGVSLSFAPSPDADGDKSDVLVTLAAAANAPPVTQVPVTITGTEQGQSPPSRQIVLPVTVLTTAVYQLRIQGIELTQGIQAFTLPSRDPNNPSAPVPYSGALLVAGRPAVVRVFADAPNAPAVGVAGAGMILSGTDSNGNPLPGSPLLAETAAPTLTDSGSATVPASERAGNSNEWDFALPESWLGRASTAPISITATMLPPAPFGSPVQNVACSDAACAALATMTLDQISALSVGSAGEVVPLQLTVKGSGPDAYSPFFWAQLLLPGGVVFDPSAGSVDITWISQGCPQQQQPQTQLCPDRDSKNTAALSTVEDFQSNYDNGSSPPMIGLTTQDLGDEDTSPTWTSRLIGENPEPAAVANAGRPVTDISHEIGHMFGLQHASLECGGGQDNDGDDTGQLGELWPPDEVGYINGIGLDIAAGVPYPVIAPSGSSQFYDLMSYCANTSDASLNGTLGSTNAWISLRNWDYIASFAACENAGGDPTSCRHQNIYAAERDEGSGSPQARQASAGPPAVVASSAGKTRVYGFVDRSGTRIAIIDPTPSHALVAGLPSPFTVALVGRHGQTLSSAGMLMTESHVDGPGGGPVLLLEGALPIRGSATAMEILNAGKVVAVTKRPRHVPSVTLLTLGVHGRLTGSKPLIVSWRVSDPDPVHLTVSLDFSSDGGRIWREIWSGTNDGRFAVPRSYLRGTRRARLRLRVSDGFDQVMLVSRRFAIAAAPPQVTIISPRSARQIKPRTTLLLSAVAIDNAGRPLGGSALKWFAGKASLGTGQELLAMLPAGTRSITLVARDTGGRTTRVTIPAPKPGRKHKPHRRKHHG